MLSGEVASGRYPVETVSRMASIINTVEDWTLSGKFNYKLILDPASSEDWQTNESVAISACETAEIIGAKAVVCLSLTGSIAREISKWRPKGSCDCLHTKTGHRKSSQSCLGCSRYHQPDLLQHRRTSC